MKHGVGGGRAGRPLDGMEHKEPMGAGETLQLYE
jgi:hypothetical protein